MERDSNEEMSDSRKTNGKITKKNMAQIVSRTSLLLEKYSTTEVDFMTLTTFFDSYRADWMKTLGFCVGSPKSGPWEWLTGYHGDREWFAPWRE